MLHCDMPDNTACTRERRLAYLSVALSILYTVVVGVASIATLRNRAR